MQIGAITSYIDVAQLALYAFFLFFAGLVYYLLQENKREGYPLITDKPGRVVQGFPEMPKPKAFLMHEGRVIMAPRPETVERMPAVAAADFPGAPLIPHGGGLGSGMGPGAWAMRLDEPDLTYDEKEPKIVPLRTMPAFFLAWEDPDPRGYKVEGLDGVLAGTVSDVWFDRSEVVVRYLEVVLEGGARSVLLPMNFAELRHAEQTVRCGFIGGAQFALAPTLKHPETITLREEDQVLGFFGGGVLYATPASADSLF